MNSQTRRVKSGKMVRVGTAFTGFAACAAGFAPAAMATTTALPVHQPLQADHLPKAAKIHESSCVDGTANWVHIGLVGGSDTCFGGKGTSTVQLAQSVNKYCGGNNKGWIRVLNGALDAKTVHFGHGTTYANFPKGYGSLSAVHISSWSGNDKCGRP
jgi:hypothetical protein